MDAQNSSPRFYILDYELNDEQFISILQGKLTIGRFDQDWAAVRLLEYAPYPDIVSLIGFKMLVDNWPGWRIKVTLESRRRGLDFLSSWLVNTHPELCGRTSNEQSSKLNQ